MQQPVTMSPASNRKDAENMKRKAYDLEMRKLQVELCRLQDWVKKSGARIIIVFEGRDAAGKGGTIKAITERGARGSFVSSRFPPPRIGRKPRFSCSATSSSFPPQEKL
jgi:polyphosphate kinase